MFIHTFLTKRNASTVKLKYWYLKRNLLEFKGTQKGVDEWTQNGQELFTYQAYQKIVNCKISPYD